MWIGTRLAGSRLFLKLFGGCARRCVNWGIGRFSWGPASIRARWGRRLLIRFGAGKEPRHDIARRTCEANLAMVDDDDVLAGREQHWHVAHQDNGVGRGKLQQGLAQGSQRPLVKVAADFVKKQNRRGRAPASG